jgi:hypothetical protein
MIREFRPRGIVRCPDEYREIAREHDDGATIKELAAKHGRSRYSIQRILSVVHDADFDRRQLARLAKA